MARVEEVSSGEEEEEPEVIVEEEQDEALQHDSDSESSDDNSEDDNDLELEKKVQELEAQIEKNPYVYEDHMQLIEALDKLSELGRMREAFKRVHGLTSLTPEHWLMRLQTESTLAHTKEEREAVHALYDQATIETYSIPIYMSWCSFASSGDDVKETRDVLEKILKRTGADPLNGKLLWDTLKEYEKDQLKLLSPESDSYKEQKLRVARCVNEQLRRPVMYTSSAREELADMELRTEIQEQIEKEHESACKYLEIISPYEDQLLTEENAENKLKIYSKYIERVRRMLDERGEENGNTRLDELIMVLYDRMSFECMSCDVELLLDDYCEFARQVSTEEYARALEVCVSRKPQLAKFWILKMHHYEREERDFDEIKSILEKALSVGLGEREQYESLWMSYLETLRRCTDFAQEEQVERLRLSFRLAWDSLGQMWGEEADPGCTILMYWARLEYQVIGDPKQGKELIEEIFQYGYNKTLNRFWLPLIELESARSPRPSTNKLRDLHRRAVKFTQDYPPAVCERWLDFERDYGTVDSLVECRKVTEEKLKEWRQNYELQKEKKIANQKQSKNKGKAQEKKSKPSEQNEGKGKKRGAEDLEVEPAKKRKEDTGSKETPQNGSLKRRGNGVDDEVSNKRQRSTDSAGQNNGDSAELPSADKEACTLFVSNLDFKFDEEALRKKLSEFGEVRSLRVVRGVKAFGGSICYCEYPTQASVDEAVKHDRAPLDGRPMFLSRYRADKSKPRFRYATQPERNKLFVKNLPFTHCTQEQLKEVFAPHGRLVEIRIVTYKDGRPKGLAYVEYADDKSASAALQKTDGLLVADRKLQVALSAPPPRADEVSLLSLGQPKRDSGGGMRRTQLSSFVPRVLQKPVAAASTSQAGASKQDTSADKQSKPMTNSDFRNMLLNNK